MSEDPARVSPQEFSTLLDHVTEARSGSAEELASVLYGELRRLARAFMARERKGHTLQPTALANEAFLRMASGERITGSKRVQFMAIAARTMRSVLIDHARKRGAAKRGGQAERVPIEDIGVSLGQPDLDVVELEGALTELARLDPRKVQVVEMRFFSGMPAKDIATVLGISAATVQDDWYAARAWLRVRLQRGA